MTSSRIIWAVSLILLSVNYIFSESYSGSWLLAGVIVVPLLSAVYAAVLCRHIEADITMPQICRKEEMIRGILLLRSSGRLPIFRADICLSVKNVMTGEEREMMFTSSLMGRHSEEIGFSLTNVLCGSVRISFRYVRIYDMFGIWRREIKPDFEYKLKVLPDVFMMNPHIMPSLRSDNESIEYSAYRPGNDMSEIFGIREYQEGDSIRNIHWKLTGKCDDIMIKLPSLPLENSVMLMLETGTADDAVHTPQVFDALAEIYITLSQTLTDNSIYHSLAWYDQQESMMFTFDIETEDDLNSVMDRILSAEYKPGNGTAAEHYITENGHIDKAHLVYVTPHQVQLPGSGLEGIRITEVICCDDRKQPGDMSEHGMNIIPCTADDYKRELSEISI